MQPYSTACAPPLPLLLLFVKNPLQIKFEKKHFAVPFVLLNLDGLWVQKVPYMKFSVNIRWDRVWRVPTGQKSSPPTLVTYPNKAETLIADDRLYV